MHYLEDGVPFPVTGKRLDRIGEGNDEWSFAHILRHYVQVVCGTF